MPGLFSIDDPQLRSAFAGFRRGVRVAVDAAQFGGRRRRERRLVLGESRKRGTGVGALVLFDRRDRDVDDVEGQWRRIDVVVAGRAAEHAVDLAEIASFLYTRPGEIVRIGGL